MRPVLGFGELDYLSNSCDPFLARVLQPLTLALGAKFLIGTRIEWHTLIYQRGLTITKNLFGTTYCSLPSSLLCVALKHCSARYEGDYTHFA